MSTGPVCSVTRAATAADAFRRTATVLVWLVALTAPLAHGQSRTGKAIAIPIDELKSVYLACNRAATGGRLATGGIMKCSIVYEELKQRAFGGDFHKLLAWSKARSSARSTGR